MSKKILKYEGFTLIEMLVNLLVVSSISVAMFTMFNHTNYVLGISKNKNDVIHFSNGLLDLIYNDIRKTNDETLFSKGEHTRTLTTTSTDSRMTTSIDDKYVINISNGLITRNDSALAFNFNQFETLATFEFKSFQDKVVLYPFSLLNIIAGSLLFFFKRFSA